MRKRFTASYKLALGFAAVALLATYGYKFANDLALGGAPLPPIAPGAVTILGVDTSQGYRIIVQNQLAKLVRGNSEAFKAGDMGEDSDDAGDRKYVPVKEMLKALGGDTKALGTFVMKINEIKDDEWSPAAVIWKSDDIDKAIGGDAFLKKKLEEDLNMHLDGSVLDHVNKNSMFNGIIVEFKVPVRLKKTGKLLEAPIRQWYRANMVRTITDINLVQSKKYYTMADVALQYKIEAAKLQDGEREKEDIAKSLQAIYAPSEISRLKEFPERIINSVTTVVNDSQISDASEASADGPKGKFFTLTFHLNNEGKKRIWQFTRDRVGSQLLIVVNGVSIAAPRIDHGINGDEVQIHNLEDESLVQEAIDTIHEKPKTIQ